MKRVVWMLPFFGLCVSLCLGSVAWGMPPELLKAYKKEFAFLHAQKQALRERLRLVESISQKRITRARRELKALQRRHLWLQSQVEKTRELLSRSERVVTRQSDSAEKLTNLFAQARFTIEKGGLSLPPFRSKGMTSEQVSQAEAARLGSLWGHVFSLVARGRRVSRDQGEFFLGNGARVKGTIVRIGEIASYGVSSQAQGALAPAGAGRLKLWPKVAASSALGMAAGRPLRTLDIFLYESLRKEVQAKVEKTWLDIVQSGGVIAWVIVALGCVALLMILLRALLLMLSATPVSALFAKIEPALSSRRHEEAALVCGKSRGAAARVMKQTIEHLGEARQRTEDIASEAILQETPRIERFASMITVCAAVAPLLGLLGTVTGMISTFDIITQHGTGDPKLLAGGISEALITTELGLIVAIPTLLLGALLSGRAEALLSDIEWSALRLMNLEAAAREKAPLVLSAEEMGLHPSDSHSALKRVQETPHSGHKQLASS